MMIGYIIMRLARLDNPVLCELRPIGQAQGLPLSFNPPLQRGG